MLRRHDEPDLVVVEARVEADLVRVVDVDRTVRPVDRRHVLAPHGTVDAREQRVANAVGVYRAHVDGMLRHERHSDERDLVPRKAHIDIANSNQVFLIKRNDF